MRNRWRPVAVRPGDPKPLAQKMLFHTTSGTTAPHRSVLPFDFGVTAREAGHEIHPVLEVAGFPWIGVEGNGFGMGVGRIPFTMGIDALLVNLTLWAAVFAFWLRRASAERVAGLATPATLLALVGGLVGGWRLVALFD